MKKRKAILHLRAAIIQSVREFFISKGFLEVETPLRIPANAPEEHIDPHQSGDFYLHTSPEICMKRLLSRRQHDKIFQICRCWRNGERGRWHVPEFTMLEWYRTDSDYNDLMTDCAALLKWLAVACAEKNWQPRSDNLLNILEQAATRISVQDAFLLFTDSNVQAAVSAGAFDELMVTQIEPALPKNAPVFLVDYPSGMAALARLKPGDTQIAERFELYLGGLELANGFSELTDPVEQKMRFLETNQRRIKAGAAPLPLPEPFLEELAIMPASAGIALGVDRLIMFMSGADRIDDVVAFTPEEL
ncbi:MAG TPA: EF-P lysine aminoacylase EpmA [Negativicutes bacterium]|jgi:lysyl-tRNA synthetase class 2